jgi:hypothetical protein
MPSVRKMTAEEVTRVEAKKAAEAKSFAAAYNEIARELSAGDEIELELDPEEIASVAISHLEQAAAQQNPALRLEFRASDDPLVLSFYVQLLHPPQRPPVSRASDLPDLFEYDEPQPRFNGPAHRTPSQANRKQRVDRPGSGMRSDRSEPRKQRNPSVGGSEQRRSKPERPSWSSGSNGQGGPPQQRSRRRPR